MLGALGAAVPAAAAPTPSVRPSALVPPALPTGAQPAGGVPSAQQITFDVVLRPSDPGGLESLLDSLYDPSSPSYHRWLAPGQFAARFGADPATVAATVTWLRGLGLATTVRDGLSVQAQGSAADVESGLGISLARYHDGGQTGYRANAAPLVPGNLAPAIEGVLGLSSGPAPVSHLVAAAPFPSHGAAPSPGVTDDAATLGPCQAANQLAAGVGAYTPTSLGAAYGVSTLLSDGLDGSGERVAVVELATPSSSDIATFQSCFGLDDPVTAVTVDPGALSGGDGTAEADTDIEQLSAQAPGAAITSYDGPDSQAGEYDSLDRAVSDDAAAIISDSWGLCEAFTPTTGAGNISAFDAVLEQAATQGQAVFAAAGDTGSEDCHSVDGDGNLAVDYPASNPWVTAVGGTSLSLDGTETVWNGCQGVAGGSECDPNSGAGGGGSSSIEPKPLWQAGLASPAGASCGTNGSECREVPDVAANAGVPEALYVEGSWGLFFGTSVAAPLVAGLWADRDAGCPESAGGDAAPTLYQLANSGGYGTAVRDITQGDNDFTGTNGGLYQAQPGYDLASGLGSVQAAGAACTVVRSVSPSQGPAGTVVTVQGLGLEDASVSMGGQPVPVLSATATSAQVEVPAGSGSVSISATGPVANEPSSATFTYGPPSGLFQRVYGQTAIDTAIAASQAAFPTPGSASAVVLARSDFFSDALAGGPLAAALDGPMLITEGAGESSSLDPAVQSEIERVLAPGGTVDILGGDLALSPGIDSTLQQLGYQTVRIAGTDEYDTAVLIAQRLGDPTHIFEATGLNFADALSAVPAAIELHGAILLTDGSTQSPETAAYLADHSSDFRYAVGGPLAAAGADPSATPVYGQDQYGTSAAVAADFFAESTVVAAATGTNFPDALAAGPIMGAADGPVLLVAPNGPLPPAIAAYLASVGPSVDKATLFGGPLAVSDQVLAELDGAL